MLNFDCDTMAQFGGRDHRLHVGALFNADSGCNGLCAIRIVVLALGGIGHRLFYLVLGFGKYLAHRCPTQMACLQLIWPDPWIRFSFALHESMQFAGTHHVLSLLSFNLGVEVGQLLVLLLVYPSQCGLLPKRMPVL